jgi:hypothetical protein
MPIDLGPVLERDQVALNAEWRVMGQMLSMAIPDPVKPRDVCDQCHCWRVRDLMLHKADLCLILKNECLPF